MKRKLALIMAAVMLAVTPAGTALGYESAETVSNEESTYEALSVEAEDDDEGMLSGETVSEETTEEETEFLTEELTAEETAAGETEALTAGETEKEEASTEIAAGETEASAETAAPEESAAEETEAEEAITEAPAVISGETAAASDSDTDEPSTVATLTDATGISTGITYNGAITATDTSSYYKFTLSTSGTITLTSTAYIRYLYYRIYDASGNQLWYTRAGWNSSTEQITLEKTMCLTSGTYYLGIERYSSSYLGTYSFKIDFASAGETFLETQGGIDNSMNDAHNISLGVTYYGQIAANDTKDYYKFTLSTSGYITLTSTAYIRYLYYRIFDEDGNQLWYTRAGWNSSTNQISLDEGIRLTSGTYYLEIERYSSDYTGNYSFKTAFTSAGESFKETNGGSNNSLLTASSISLNTVYYGQIAINDTKDFYKFTLSAATTLQLKSTAKMTRLYYRIFDASGSQVWYKSAYYNSSTGQITLDESVTLSAGTYYLEMERYSSSYLGTYSFSLSRTLGTCTISSLTNVSSGVTVKWSKVSNAAGYYIYRKTASGSYSLIKTITSGSTVKYTDTKVKNKNGKTYIYKVVPYSGIVTGGYSEETIVRLSRPALSSVKNTSYRSIVVKWDKVSKVTGYQIQYSTSKSFTSGNVTKKIAGASVKKYTISGRTLGRTYYVRIRTYKTLSGKTYYSAWSAKKSVKITK